MCFYFIIFIVNLANFECIKLEKINKHDFELELKPELPILTSTFNSQQCQQINLEQCQHFCNNKSNKNCFSKFTMLFLLSLVFSMRILVPLCASIFFIYLTYYFLTK